VQLLALLPSQRSFAAKPDHPQTAQSDIQPVTVIGRIQLIVAITLFMLLSQLLFAGLYANAPADKSAPPGVSAPSPAGKEND
jgi:hypothetical protein